ncbi:radical SAM protein [Tahibacter amnicola]|uniref:Radical SAM protein n=2 Tax=Tahibacter amnicola TaxID=2976241 RepID=A0ABY6BMI6_9GAMM|nr:radical SAM protein [Tahibacter amnicola]UXI70678.1 radical SAM protein [Tahibacter amnicola]
MIRAGLRRAPSVSHCTFPWKWLVVTEKGDVMPCCFTNEPIGNLRDQSVDEVWNGKAMKTLRRRITQGRVHPLCARAGCAYLASRPDKDGVPVGYTRPQLTESEAVSFDDAAYLANNPDVAAAVERGLLADGLDHYAQFGKAEGRQFPNISNVRNTLSPSAQALISYSRGEAVVTHAPTQVVLGVTTQCNLTCVMCPHGVGTIADPQHLPESTVEKLMPSLRSARWIELVGIGEPLLSPAFWTVLAEKQLAPDVYIRSNCNGYLLVQPYIDRLLDSPLREISISLDAATEETYRRIRGGDLRRVIRNLKALTARRRERGSSQLKIHVNMTLMRTNIAEVARVVSLARECDVDAVHLSQLSRFPHIHDWRVTRGDWVFDYAAEMLDYDADAARQPIRDALDAAAKLEMPLVLQNGTSAWQ